MEKSGGDEKIIGLRREIDSCDERIAAAVERRLELVGEIARVKNESQIPIYDARREAEIIERFAKSAHGGQVSEILRAVIAVCRSAMNDVSITDER